MTKLIKNEFTIIAKYLFNDTLDNIKNQPSLLLID